MNQKFDKDFQSYFFPEREELFRHCLHAQEPPGEARPVRVHLQPGEARTHDEEGGEEVHAQGADGGHHDHVVQGGAEVRHWLTVLKLQDLEAVISQLFLGSTSLPSCLRS